MIVASGTKLKPDSVMDYFRSLEKTTSSLDLHKCGYNACVIVCESEKGSIQYLFSNKVPWKKAKAYVSQLDLKPIKIFALSDEEADYALYNLPEIYSFLIADKLTFGSRVTILEGRGEGQKATVTSTEKDRKVRVLCDDEEEFRVNVKYLQKI